MITEIWADISDFPDYEISNLGNVRNKGTHTKLTPKSSRQGYLHIGLYKDKRRCNVYVHRLVAMVFCNGYKEGLVVNHKDGNKANNVYSNLEWVTHSDNIKHAYCTGLKKGSKLSGTPRKFVRIVETGEVFESIRDCAKAINADHSDVSDCMHGRNNRVTCHGFHFEEISEDEFKSIKHKKQPFLYPHQQQAIDRMFTGAILNGGVGSGKSRTGLYYYFSQNGGKIEGNEYTPMGIPFEKKPPDLYIITTAKKRNDLEWEMEMIPFFLSTDPKRNMFYGNKVIVDSWQNIKKYADVKDAFFIFDEDKVTGNGVWVKAFLKIAKHNEWIILSATAGDKWEDYIPVFIANGFYKNRTEFSNEHLIYSRFAKFPQVTGYRGEGRLIRLRDKLLIDMDFQRHTVQHHEDVFVSYDKIKYRDAIRTRWDPFKNEPIQQAAGLCYVLRRIVNDSDSRQLALLELFEKHPRMIVFYNFDYERETLLDLYYGEDVAVAEYSGHAHQPIPDTDKWVYIVQYTAGCEGFNCIKTDTIVFYSQNYSYKVLAQAVGRIDRLNTPYTDLYYYHLKTRSGIDLAISKALSEKKKFNERKWSKWDG